jgi:hypothetical protein
VLILNVRSLRKSTTVENYGQLSVILANGRRKVMDKPKPWLKQIQSKYGTKWI